MKVKIDTKAHFKVFTVNGSGLHANMAEQLEAELRRGAATEPGHLILILEPPFRGQDQVLERLGAFAAEMGTRNLSFVITGIGLVGKGESLADGRRLNIVPTYQEAVDLVMMEEMERELGAEDAPSREGPEA